MATTARETMTTGVECVGETETVGEAARKMARLDIGALPICGEDDRLKGMITDRDIVVKVIAEGLDPEAIAAGDLGEGKPFTVDADAPLSDVVREMKVNAVRRLPVIDNHRLIGIISQRDIAEVADDSVTGRLVEAISVSG